MEFLTERNGDISLDIRKYDVMDDRKRNFYEIDDMNSRYEREHIFKKPKINNYSNYDITMDLQSPNQNDSRNELRLELNNDILPPCFNSLMNPAPNHSPILASPDINLLKLASPELENLIMAQGSINSCDDLMIKEELEHNNGLLQSRMSLSPKRGFRSYEDMKIKSHINAVSPIISAQDLHFITETNKALVSLLPPKPNDTAPDLLIGNELDFQSDFLEPLQQVPNVSGYDESFLSPTNNNNNNNKHRNTETYSEDETKSVSSFYEVIEEHVRNQQMYKRNKINISQEVLDNYVPEDQDLIKRYIQDDNDHLPLPPINLEIQEIIKRERKKLKNRVAASKCRKKKLAREAQLEINVNHLKERSIELSSIAHALRNQATELKQRIIDHMSAGCNISLNLQNHQNNSFNHQNNSYQSLSNSFYM